jgi:competence transcription factor ComK
MKVIALAIAMLVLGESLAVAGPIYDRNGNPIHSVTRGNVITHYDINGRVVSTGIIHSDFSTSTYDQCGRLFGKSYIDRRTGTNRIVTLMTKKEYYSGRGCRWKVS